jgi:DNA polymerase-3 subunit delta'
MELLRRSLDRGRLGHAYLFTGDSLEDLEERAVEFIQWALEKSFRSSYDSAEPPIHLNPAFDDRVRQKQHPDISWVRPESRTRWISIDLTREIIRNLNLRPMEASIKVAVFVAADRMNDQAANAFLKTLEEPPAGCILLLLSTEPERLLETILSRCLRLNFGTGKDPISPPVETWIRDFADQSLQAGPSLLARFKLLGSLAGVLTDLRNSIKETLTERSPLTRYPDAPTEQIKRWEEALNAAIEAEYRRRRNEFLAGLHAWLRDLWVLSLGAESVELTFRSISEVSKQIASGLEPKVAVKNLEAWEDTRRLLFTNVQESLALEVGLLRLRFTHAARSNSQ